MDAHGRLTQIAAVQHGLVTADQAMRAGLGVEQIRWLSRSGRWRAVRPRVYALVGAPPTRTQAVAAAVYAAGPMAWASHATAGVLWGMPLVEAPSIEVVAPPERKVGLSGVRGHRSAALFTNDLSTFQRIPLTSPERTLVDLSARYDDRALGRILDDGLRRRVIRLDRLRACSGRLVEGPGRRPSAIQALLGERLPGYDPGDSDLETRVLRLLVSSGFLPPVQQHRLRLGGRTMRVDLAYPALRVAIELDGWEFHGTRTAFDDDRARANLLVADGWSLVRFTSRSTDIEIVGCIRATLDRFGRSGAA
ncbi:MAG TPA: type IV toxin-antitoxin system AbiEi family antitoxin domain-containing protein [Acidimicrobiales bacterium]|nr:type IV toxin-antitoxin system AbiEi family antitoxin domain-containing protein [Acidimicrobiales bacterium]